MKSAVMSRSRRVGGDYFDLVRQFPLRIIQSDAEMEAAHRMLRRLFLKDEAELSQAESDYLGAVTLLVEEYERARFSFPKSATTPLERLRHLVENAGLTTAELMKLLGVSQPQVSLLLSGKRELSKANVKRLAAHFRLDASYFL
jgi:HTH-type transcriptional regulator/antitoxin HigA